MQSSRRLEREAGRNLEVMWLLGRLVPDDKVIADFRKDNGPAIRKVCARFVDLCRKMGLLTKASVAIDGSKFKAVNNRDRNFTRGEDRSAAQAARGERGALSVPARHGRPAGAIRGARAKTTRLKEKLEKLKEEMAKLAAYEKQMLASPDQQISLTDPDCRSMATSGRGSGVVGYNVQVAVDTEHHLIVTHEVTNTGSDRSQLGECRKAGEGSSAGGQARSRRRPRLLQQRGNPGVRGGRHHRDAAEADDIGREIGRALRQAGFCLSADEDVYRCPAGERLKYYFTAEEHGQQLRRYWTNACRTCALKTQVHHGTAAPHHPLGARARARSRAAAARRKPAGHAHAARNGRASLRHDQGAHGRDALC